MNNKPLDLSALATSAEAERWAKRLGDVRAQSRAIAAHHHSNATPVDYLVAWFRPAVTAAVVLIALALATLGRELTIVPVPNGAAGLATIARVWAAGGPSPSGEALVDIVEASRP